MSRADGILHLVLNAHPWDEIKAGRKPVEYRSLRWESRIFGKPTEIPGFGVVHLDPGNYTHVRLQRGFRKIDGKVPTLLYKIDHVDIGPADPRWTYGIIPEGSFEFLRIWLGEQILPDRSLAAISRGVLGTGDDA